MTACAKCSNHKYHHRAGRLGHYWLDPLSQQGIMYIQTRSNYAKIAKEYAKALKMEVPK